jgi:CXXX repeat radical SAM target protein
MKNSNKSVKDKTAENNLLNQHQSRREFFKTASKIALPTIAFLGLSSFGSDLIGLNNNFIKRSSTTCENSCEDTCTADCAGGCSHDCEITCWHNCSGSCEGLCEGQCEGKSGPSTNKSLEETSCDCTGCTGSCLGPCKGDCMSECNRVCQGSSMRTPSPDPPGVRG